MLVTWPLQDSDVCGRSLTCVLEACSHALVKLAPPLPGSQLLVLLTGLQGEAVPLCLGGQVRCSLFSLLHQGAEVGFPTLYAHDCNGKHSAASVNHVHDLTGNQFSLRLVQESWLRGRGITLDNPELIITLLMIGKRMSSDSSPCSIWSLLLFGGCS